MKMSKIEIGDVVRFKAKQNDIWPETYGMMGREFVVVADKTDSFFGDKLFKIESDNKKDHKFWNQDRFELVRRNPESLKRVRLVITTKDFKEAKGWPNTKLRRAVARQVKKTCKLNIGATLGYIDDWEFDLNRDDMDKKYMAGKTFHVYLDIPRKYLKNPN
jgi:hypothetical protein